MECKLQQGKWGCCWAGGALPSHTTEVMRLFPDMHVHEAKHRAYLEHFRPNLAISCTMWSKDMRAHEPKHSAWSSELGRVVCKSSSALRVLTHPFKGQLDQVWGQGSVFTARVHAGGSLLLAVP
eukprot:1157270-Pelagomonas_calceolata.AAC.16